MLNLEKLVLPENSTLHKIKRYRNIPRKNGKPTKTSWIDQVDIRYTYDMRKPNILVINSPLGFYPDSIMDYINNLPEEITTVVLEIDCKEIGTAGINMLMNLLRRVRPNRNIILPVKKYQMGKDTAFDYYRLPNNVKFTNTLDLFSLEDDAFYGENPFDWWLLHLNDQQFNNIVLKMTKNTAKRAKEFRTIAKEYYCKIKLSYPEYDLLSDIEKANLAYNFVKNITKYDIASTTTSVNGTYVPKPGCSYASDPLETFKRRKGICTGRSRLLKTILNNRYSKVNCFLVDGVTQSGDNHEFVEIITDDKNYYYDLSFGIKGERNISYSDIKHRDAAMSGIFINKNNKSNNTMETTSNNKLYAKRMPNSNEKK